MSKKAHNTQSWYALSAILLQVLLTLPDEFPVSLLGHPTRSGKVAFMNHTAALWMVLRIELEENANHFPPIGTIPIRIEDSQIKDHVLLIVACQVRFIGRSIPKCRLVFIHQSCILSYLLVLSQSTKACGFIIFQFWVAG